MNKARTKRPTHKPTTDEAWYFADKRSEGFKVTTNTKEKLRNLSSAFDDLTDAVAPTAKEQDAAVKIDQHLGANAAFILSYLIARLVKIGGGEEARELVTAVVAMNVRMAAATTTYITNGPPDPAATIL